MTATELPLVPVPAAPAGHEYRHVTVERYAGPCGAVVSGVDLAADLDDDVIAEIRRALLDHGVLFFRDQSLSPERQVAFSRRFGPYSPVPFVQAIPDHPEVIAVVREPSEQQGFAFGGIWHSDFSFLPEPPMGSILHAIEVPPYGADTLWANQYLAYRTLSRGMRRLVAGLRGVHSAINAYSPKMQAVHDLFVGMTVKTGDEANEMREHPAVRVHAETGERALFVNQQYTIGLADFHPHEAKLLLDHLFRHSTQESFTCRWRWRAGDVAFWDNRCVQHMVMADVSGYRRYMHRTTVAGEAPVPATDERS
ncbi:MAG: alpha-ketoglutarate-dependent taurine dioxygenase [Acidimicrobiia bacterium]|nr:MAG: alpha-ketoglutarate-dependent taurine dioxygenase [Acidimicrobiia bacterium]